MAAEVSSTMAPPTDLARYPPPPDSTVHQPPTFLTLPAEIRLRIYSLLFDEIWIYERYKDQDCCWGYACDNCRFGDDYVPAESACQCRESRCVHRLCHCCSPLSLGLLRVCKPIHNEAIAVFDNAPITWQFYEFCDPDLYTEYMLPANRHSRVEKLIVDTKLFRYGFLHCVPALRDLKSLRTIWVKPSEPNWINDQFEEVLLGYAYDFYRFELLPGQLEVSIVSLPLPYGDFCVQLQRLISKRSATIKTPLWCSIEVTERVLLPSRKKEVLICDSTGLRIEDLPNLANESWFKEWSQYARLRGPTGYKNRSWDKRERYKIELGFRQDYL
ncbi:hypothetical protein LTR92_007650 [Exophiala xenobiotica]|nr:hypothetical protein LTR92_007650 [Exophiala xenobiotica]